MTLDEAIKRYTSNAEYERTNGNLQGCLEFKQLTEWLKELKDYKERMPSYEAGYNDAKREIALSGEYERAYERGKADAQPKIGRWVKTPKAVMGEGYMWYCNKCEHQVYQDSSRPYPSEKFCPNCGARMVSE